MLAMCSTGSTSSAGSPKASPWYDERYNAGTPSCVPQRSSRTCSEPALPSYAEPITSPKPTRSISTGSSTLIHVLRTAWDALQELYQLYEADNPDQANQALGRFADLYATGQIPQYHQVVDTIIAWGEQILAYHTSRRATNGPIEGTNNLLQVLRRVAHGFTNPNNYAARGILVTLIMVGSSAGAGLTHLVTGLWCLCHDLSTWPPLGLLNRGAG